MIRRLEIFLLAAGALAGGEAAAQFGAPPDYQLQGFGQQTPFGVAPQQSQSQYQQQQQQYAPAPAFDFNALMPLLEEWGREEWGDGEGYYQSGPQRSQAPPTREQLLLLPPAQLRELLLASVDTMQQSLGRLRNGETWFVYLKFDDLRTIATGDMRSLDEETAGLLSAMAQSATSEPPQRQAVTDEQTQAIRTWLRQMQEQVEQQSDDAMAVAELESLAATRQREKRRAAQNNGCLEAADIEHLEVALAMQIEQLAPAESGLDEDAIQRLKAFIDSQRSQLQEPTRLDDDTIARLEQFIAWQQQQSEREATEEALARLKALLEQSRQQQAPREPLDEDALERLREFVRQQQADSEKETRESLARLKEFLQQIEEERARLANERLALLREFIRQNQQESDRQKEATVMLMQFVDEAVPAEEPTVMLMQFVETEDETEEDVLMLLQFSDVEEEEAEDVYVLIPPSDDDASDDVVTLLPLDDEGDSEKVLTLMPLGDDTDGESSSGSPFLSGGVAASARLNDLAASMLQRAQSAEPTRPPDADTLERLQAEADRTLQLAEQSGRCDRAEDAMRSRQLQQAVDRYRAVGNLQGDLSLAQRQQVLSIARRFDQTAANESYAQVSRRNDFQTLHAVVAALATPPAEREATALRSVLATLVESLDRIESGASWKRYLGLESLHRAGIADGELMPPSLEDLRASLARFDEVSSEPNYRAVANLEGFSESRDRLRRLVEAQSREDESAPSRQP